MNLVEPADASELLPLLRAGSRAPLDEVEQRLARIEAVEPRIEAFLPEPGRADRLRAAAAKLEKAHPEPASRPPLYGLLLGVKDIFRVNGFETRAGSQLPPDLFSGKQAGSVTTLQDAGALIAGKTVTTEFAYFDPGPTRNPWNPEHTPGGSSSGSAAAVAAGFCHAALGTQTIGSIIRPAAFCGIVGFKPSYGRISADGVFPFSVSADHVGIFAANVATVTKVAAQLCRSWNHKRATVNSNGNYTEPSRAIIVPDERYLAQADRTARFGFDQAVEKLVKAGFAVHPSPLFDDIDDINAAHNDMVAAEFAQVHAAWFDKHQALYGLRSAELVERGRAIPSSRLSEARDGRGVLRQKITNQAEELGASLWVSPSAASAAPKGIHATGSPIMNLPWTYAGVPAVTVPCGLSADGLPLGLQLTARYDRDETLLRRALEIEELLRP